MLLKTILNAIEPHKGFVFGSVRWRERDGAAKSLEIDIRPRTGSKPICSGCGRKCPGYDRLDERRFEFVPLWGILVFFLYTMRRVDCCRCGVKVEQVPWASGNHHLTTTYQWFLSRWGKRLSWKEVAEVFRTSWDSVFRAVHMAVHWGLEHRDLDGIEAIGVDEIQWRRGHKYMTLVYQIDAGCRRLLWVGKDRTVMTLAGFFRMLGKKRSSRLRYVCSDMWQPYLRVISRLAGQALHVLDRYHIMATMNRAIDLVRATEAKQLVRDGYEPVLKRSRWLLLKRPSNLTEKQTVKLSELLRYNLKSVRAYLLREEFQRLWSYKSAFWASRFLDEWCRRVMRSRIEPMKKVARTIRKHEELILNWFRAKGSISAGIVEGLNGKVKLTMRKSYGFRTEETIKIALYHALGDLPEPEATHRFC